MALLRNICTGDDPPDDYDELRDDGGEDEPEEDEMRQAKVDEVWRCQCSECRAQTDRDRPSFSEACADARRLGWTDRGGRWLCPVCAPKTRAA